MHTKPDEVNPVITKFILTPVAWLVAFLFALPVIWMLISSFRPNKEIAEAAFSLSLDTFLPSIITLENFIELLSGPFAQAIKNSFIVASSAVIGGLLICSLAAFALSAIEWRFKNLVFSLVIICFTVPVDSVAIPLSILVRNWGLRDTYIGLTIPWLAEGMAIFLLRQFFIGIPKDFVDAARVDGASWWTIYWRIYMPLSIPALIGAALILFIFQWEGYLWPLLITTNAGMDVAPVALVKIVLGRFYTNWGQMFAGAVILAGIPALILLPLQRYFTQSIKTSGIKG